MFLLFLLYVFCFFVFYFTYSAFFKIVLCIVSHFVLSPISAQVYRPLPPDGNPITVNKYILSFIINVFHVSVL